MKLKALWLRMKNPCNECYGSGKVSKCSENHVGCLPCVVCKGTGVKTEMPKPVKQLKPRRPIKRSRKPIRRVSKRMSATASLYRQKRKWFLVQYPLCQVFKDRPSEEIHHRKGRGKYLLDETTWLAVSREAHTKIHNNVAWSYKQGWMLKRSL